MGESNKLAYGACLSLTKASKKAENFNPLFYIWTIGVGKNPSLKCNWSKISGKLPQKAM